MATFLWPDEKKPNWFIFIFEIQPQFYHPKVDVVTGFNSACRNYTEIIMNNKRPYHFVWMLWYVVNRPFRFARFALPTLIASIFLPMDSTGKENTNLHILLTCFCCVYRCVEIFNGTKFLKFWCTQSNCSTLRKSAWWKHPQGFVKLQLNSFSRNEFHRHYHQFAVEAEYF